MLTEDFWRKYFKYYDILNELEPYRNTLISIIGCIKPQDNLVILDAGCGTGNLMFEIAARVKLKKIIGLDYSTVALEIARKKASMLGVKGLDFKQGSLAQPLQFPENFFDVIVMNNVLYTLVPEIRDSTIREFKRILKPGGQLIMSNLSTNFSPFSIYKNHFYFRVRKVGYIRAFSQFLYYLYPTIAIFYCNWLIRKEAAGGQYEFIRPGYYRKLLGSEFQITREDFVTYAGSALLVSSIYHGSYK